MKYNFEKLKETKSVEHWGDYICSSGISIFDGAAKVTISSAFLSVNLYHASLEYSDVIDDHHRMMSEAEGWYEEKSHQRGSSGIGRVMNKDMRKTKKKLPNVFDYLYER